MDSARRLGFRSGVALVVANMVGAGVFLSAGFMAQEMGPGPILLAWVAGAVLAFAGAVAYGDVAARVPRSGGEYRYLSELWHPALGLASGWASLLVGFSAPIAVNALAAAAFARTLGLDLGPAGGTVAGLPVSGAQLFAVALVVLLTAAHAASLETSKRLQNLLVGASWMLLVGFVGLGLARGAAAWPTWQPPSASDGFPLGPFMGSLFYIAFAFAGWNAAVYAAEEFREPRRDVPRAMLAGTALVAVLYLLVNWVFVANLTPERATVVFSYEESRITLGHLVTRDFAGEAGAAAMSVLALLAFVSSTSAMTFAGPRVYAAMARDGFLPRVLAGRDGEIPTGSVLLQGCLAVGLVLTHGLAALLANVGAVLTLFSALTVASVLRAAWRRAPEAARPRPLVVAAALLYVLSAAWMLVFGVRTNPTLVYWLATIVVVALVAWLRLRAPRPVSAALPPLG